MERAKKDCILAEAAKAFARFGFKKASVDEIAKRAGVAKGTVYLAAESKEDLFYQVLHREVRAWVADCSRVIDPRVPADELMVTLLASSMEYLEKRPLVRELMFGEVMRTMPLWRDRLQELRLLGGANVAEVLRLGIRQGVFRADLDVEVVASLLQDLEFAAFLFHGGDGGKDAREQLVRRAQVGLDLVLNGLKGRDGAGKGVGSGHGHGHADGEEHRQVHGQVHEGEHGRGKGHAQGKGGVALKG